MPASLAAQCPLRLIWLQCWRRARRCRKRFPQLGPSSLFSLECQRCPGRAGLGLAWSGMPTARGLIAYCLCVNSVMGTKGDTHCLKHFPHFIPSLLSLSLIL